MQDTNIVSVAIHPSIGIARVGDSPTESFIGPETTEPGPAPPGGYRDEGGALKRQAARFRIYGYNAAGQVVKEITSDDASITWTARVANRKAAWYNFVTALDIEGAQPTTRRNKDFSGDKRALLVIDPGARSVTGPGQDGAGARFDTGTFVDTPVYLGELRTDEKGRLLFLGGHGLSDSYDGKPPTTFADNDGWHDDTADGPVDATVTLPDGTTLQAKGAWVVVAPPNYAPDQVGFQTMFDVIENVFTDPADVGTVSFTEHVWPLLRQLTDLQWVNYGIAVEFGWDAPYDFTRPGYLAKLASNDTKYAEVRRNVFLMFRQPDTTQIAPEAWPPFYGDNMDPDMTNPDSLMAVTPTLYARLQKWAEGDFVSDWTGAPAPVSIDQVPLEAQPAMLDKANLWFCLGGPFHPGCEITWPMRLSTMYSEPFRVKRRPADQPQPDYGDALLPIPPGATPPPGTPYHEQGPGDLTQWMAVPWQTDTASCRGGYDASYDAYIPTFWPARVPNTVLAADAYAKVMDASLPMEARMDAFNTRMDWDSTLPGGYMQQIAAMVKLFPRMGLVTLRPGPGLPQFPAFMYVSDGQPAPTTLKAAERAPARMPRINPRVLAHQTRPDGA